jgi:hypothetical protein
MASRTALCAAALHLSVGVRAIEVVAYAKFRDGFHFLVLFIQTGAWNTLAEKAHKCVLIGIIE